MHVFTCSLYSLHILFKVCIHVLKCVLKPKDFNVFDPRFTDPTFSTSLTPNFVLTSKFSGESFQASKIHYKTHVERVMGRKFDVLSSIICTINVNIYWQSSAKTTPKKLQLKLPYVFIKVPHKNISNYTRAKILVLPKGENDTYTKCKHLHSLCKDTFISFFNRIY